MNENNTPETPVTPVSSEPVVNQSAETTVTPVQPVGPSPVNSGSPLKPKNNKILFIVLGICGGCLLLSIIGFVVFSILFASAFKQVSDEVNKKIQSYTNTPLTLSPESGTESLNPSNGSNNTAVINTDIKNLVMDMCDTINNGGNLENFIMNGAYDAQTFANVEKLMNGCVSYIPKTDPKSINVSGYNMYDSTGTLTFSSGKQMNMQIQVLYQQNELKLYYVKVNS